MENAGIIVEWQSINGVYAATTSQLLIFTPGIGDVRSIPFSGEVDGYGEYTLVLIAKETGSTFAMDTFTIILNAEDPRLKSNIVDDQTDAVNKLLKQPAVQAILGVVILLALIGTLYIRSKSNTICLLYTSPSPRD